MNHSPCNMCPTCGRKYTMTDTEFNSITVINDEWVCRFCGSRWKMHWQYEEESDE